MKDKKYDNEEAKL